jgi:hypothetical protein
VSAPMDDCLQFHGGGTTEVMRCDIAKMMGL